MSRLHVQAYPSPGTIYGLAECPPPTSGTIYDACFNDNSLNAMAIPVYNLNGQISSLNNGAGSLAALSLATFTTAAEIMFTLPVSVTGYSGNAVLVYVLSASGASTSNPVTIASTASPGYVWTLGSCTINGQGCALNQSDMKFYPTQAITLGGIVTATIAGTGFNFA